MTLIPQINLDKVLQERRSLLLSHSDRTIWGGLTFHGILEGEWFADNIILAIKG